MCEFDFVYRYRPSNNVSPGFNMPVVRREDDASAESDGHVVHCMKWGLIPSFTKKTDKPDHYKMVNFIDSFFFLFSLIWCQYSIDMIHDIILKFYNPFGFHLMTLVWDLRVYSCQGLTFVSHSINLCGLVWFLQKNIRV